MSRVGSKPIPVPEKVGVQIEGRNVNVEGPKGKMSLALPLLVRAQLKDGWVTVSRENESKKARSLHGLGRTLINNMFLGVTQGFSKELEIQGVGYKAQIEKGKVNLTLGKSHAVYFQIPAGVTVETPKPTQIVIQGMDKVLVGQTAASIRALYPAEPYKGMGIRYAGEIVRRKAGKAVASKS
ncbi:MAG: 50S ribosomal protein L6 [Candidatus Omnitrophica bacterium]|nr:50S ribosomal protein L6 [Candidatus Omnitrophota bacterium]